MDCRKSPFRLEKYNLFWTGFFPFRERKPPMIVRPRKDGTYEIMSGHRRKFAAERIGYRKVPIIIRVLKDDDAVVSMVDSNL